MELMTQLQLENLETILAKITHWAARCHDIMAVALVGSYARGTARADSDIDLMFLTYKPSCFRQNTSWMEEINLGAKIDKWKDANYGEVWSRHVYLEDETEIEFSFGLPLWASVNPVDSGTFNVVNDGCRILYDSKGLLKKLLAQIGSN